VIILLSKIDATIRHGFSGSASIETGKRGVLPSGLLQTVRGNMSGSRLALPKPGGRRQGLDANKSF